MTGERVHHYEVLERVGEGGMGTVYRARDTRLDRFVALKVLPAGKSDQEHRERFLREARAASALHHPNIVVIHDILEHEDRQVLVMEFVEGRPLSEIIPEKGMPPADMLRYAIPLASALAAAHKAGIVHRDLKPANVMVTVDGHLKVLDFGLAKFTMATVAAPADPEHDETQTLLRMPSAHTAEGAILGTPAYMSPEQAQGRPVDARSDIFSFGTLAYEMLTGRKAFQGDSGISTLAALLRDQPEPISRLSPGVPPALVRIIERCLEKDPAKRWQTMPELLAALEAVRQSGAAVSPWRRRAALGVVLIAAAIVLAASLWFVTRPAQENSLSAERTLVDAHPLTTYPGHELAPAFSPDGAQVAFSWNGPNQDNFDIYVKVIGTEEPLRLTAHPGEDAHPAWSPDGRWLAFLRRAEGPRWSLVLVAPLGGPERLLGEVQSPSRRLGASAPAWTPDSRSLILVEGGGPGAGSSLVRIDVNSGERHPIGETLPRPAVYQSPTFSPDGRRLAFIRVDMRDLTSTLCVAPWLPASATVGETTTLAKLQGRVNGLAWKPDSSALVYSMAEDSERSGLFLLPRGGKPSPLMLDRAGESFAQPAVAASASRLAFVHSTLEVNIWKLPVGAGARGAPAAVALIASTRLEYEPDWTADGARIAFVSNRSGNAEIWTCLADGSHPSQLTRFGGARVSSPRWSPDGTRIVFQASKAGRSALYLVNSSGGLPQMLAMGGMQGGGPSWSRDGQWIYFHAGVQRGARVWRVAAGGGTPAPVTQGSGMRAVESADGKYLYFARPGEGFSIWRKQLPDGAEELVVDSILSNTFTLGRNGFYYVPRASGAGPWEVNYYDFQSRQERVVARSERRPFLGFAVSPDERFILYAQVDQEESDIQMVDNFR